MAKYLPEKIFSFISTDQSLDVETFGVVKFSGIEGISVPYEFEIMLVSDNADIDMNKMLSKPVKFTIHRDSGGDVDFNGILASFEQLHHFDGYYFYSAHLVPRLWWLGLSHHNQVSLNMNVKEIVENTLKDAGLLSLDYSFNKLIKEYQPMEYVCQYNESHLNFISRWIEREGIYYYFEQNNSIEKIIFTDTNIAHTDLPLEGSVDYAPGNGLVEPEKKEIVNSFICRRTQLPGKVYMKDYNNERPSIPVTGSADVDLGGRGTDYLYSEHFKTTEDGDRLAKLHAESLNCRKLEFTGESTIPFMSPGYLFHLHGHFRSDFNQKYLVTGITHEGNQIGYLLPAITQGLPREKNNIYYRNSFTAIPASVQFRPERKAIKTRISGTIHAKIDAEGSGKYAELDEQGRYKVQLPFDTNDEHCNGKASAWIRMMQPYANEKGGMQFPLTKETGVLLTFIDGDPDRPIIAGAVANPETKSPVTAGNQTESVIQTGGNNRIRMEDKAGKERIIMESPTANSWVRIGAPNDPPPFDNANHDATQDTLIAANASKNTSQDDKIAALEAKMANVDKDPGNGIRIQTSDNFWLEAQNRFGDYVVGGPTLETDVPADIKYLWDKFFSEDPDFTPTGMKLYGYGSGVSSPVAETDLATMKALARKGRVKLFKGDTFNTQEGNIYDFGGYWNYNMGNSYEEKFMKQSNITLNLPPSSANLDGKTPLTSLPYDKAAAGGPGNHTIEHLPTGDNVWVTKTIQGASYDYSAFNKSLEVNYKCNSYEYKYGGRSEEYKFTGEGIKVAHSWSEKCQSVEESFDPTTGSLLSYEFKDHKHFSYLAKIPTYPTLNISTCASAAAETSINISASATLAMNISASTGLKMDLGASMFLALKGHLGGDHTYNLNSKEWKSDLPFTQIYKNADFKASLEKAALRKVTADINKFDLVLESKELMIKHGKASISATNLAIFS